MNELIANVQKKWDEHELQAFPSGYRSKKLNGLSVTVIQSEIAGFILTFTATGGSLGSRQKIALAQHIENLKKIIEEADTAEAKAYFQNLLDIAIEVHDNCHDNPI